MKYMSLWIRCLLVAGLVLAPAVYGQEEKGEEKNVERDVRVERDAARDARDARERTRVVVRGIGPDTYAWHWVGGGGFLGVEPTDLTPELRTHFGVPENAGVLVGRVAEDSPAATAGLIVGDIVTRVDGTEVSSARELAKVIRGKEEGAEVELEYWRDGATATTFATIGKREVHSFGSEDFTFDVEGLEALKDLPLHIAPDVMERVESSLEKVFESEEWKEQIEQLQEINMEELETRMEEMQERLKELEKRLEEKGAQLREESSDI